MTVADIVQQAGVVASVAAASAVESSELADACCRRAKAPRVGGEPSLAEASLDAQRAARRRRVSWR